MNNSLNFLIETLRFYSNIKNYEKTNLFEGKMMSMVEIDGGFQAQFALDEMENLKSEEENTIIEINKLFENENNNDDSLSDIIKTIENLKKYNNEQI